MIFCIINIDSRLITIDLHCYVFNFNSFLSSRVNRLYPYTTSEKRPHPFQNPININKLPVIVVLGYSIIYLG